MVLAQVHINKDSVVEPSMSLNLAERNKLALQFMEIAVNEYVFRTPLVCTHSNLQCISGSTKFDQYVESERDVQFLLLKRDHLVFLEPRNLITK